MRQSLTLPALPRDLLRVIGMWRWILLGQEEDHWAEAARANSTSSKRMTQGKSHRLAESSAALGVAVPAQAEAVSATQMQPERQTSYGAIDCAHLIHAGRDVVAPEGARARTRSPTTPHGAGSPTNAATTTPAPSRSGAEPQPSSLRRQLTGGETLATREKQAGATLVRRCTSRSDFGARDSPRTRPKGLAFSEPHDQRFGGELVPATTGSPRSTWRHIAGDAPLLATAQTHNAQSVVASPVCGSLTENLATHRSPTAPSVGSPCTSCNCRGNLDGWPIAGDLSECGSR